MRYTTHQGWKIGIRLDIHMYCHRLDAIKQPHRLTIPCEDLTSAGEGKKPALEATKGIFINELKMELSQLKNLRMALMDWAATQPGSWRIYSSHTQWVEVQGI